MPVMFEGSLFSSQIQPASTRRSRTFAASIAIQLTLVAAVLAIPVFHPEALSLLPAAVPILLLPPRHVTPPRPVQVQVTPDRSIGLRAPAAAQTDQPARLGRAASPNVEGPPMLLVSGIGIMGDSALPVGFGSPSGKVIRVGTSGNGEGSMKESGPVAVSSGVSAGMLLEPFKPTYPRIAVAARQSGTVILSAIIDKSGHITALKVVSGPGLLRDAALDAVRIARYRPFLLNGQPTEVETTISVNFRLHS